MNLGWVLKSIAWVVLVTFTTPLINPTVLAAQSAQKTAPAALDEGGSEEFTKTIEDIEAKLARLKAKLAQGQPRGAEEDDLRRLHRRLPALYRAAREEFQAIERHLLEAGLPPEILDCHHEMLRPYDAEFSTLTDDLKAIEEELDAGRRESRVRDALDRLKSKQHQPVHPPFDPRRCPSAFPRTR